MSGDLMSIAQGAVESIRPMLDVSYAVATGAAGSAVWDWVKQKLGSGSGAFAIEGVESEPANDLKWNLLAATLVDVLSQEPALAEELTHLLGGADRIQGTQTISNVGSGSKISQVMGRENQVNIS